jgi:hypothetical protein
LRGKQPEFGQLGAQGGGRTEMDRVNAERAGSVRIRGDIVDIDGAFRVDCKALEPDSREIEIDQYLYRVQERDQRQIPSPNWPRSISGPAS